MNAPVLPERLRHPVTLAICMNFADVPVASSDLENRAANHRSDEEILAELLAEGAARVGEGRPVPDVSFSPDQRSLSLDEVLEALNWARG